MNASTTTPCVAWVPNLGAHPGEAVGLAFDELVAFAIEQGAGDDELRERLDEALLKAHDDSFGKD